MKILVINAGSSSVKSKLYKFGKSVKEIYSINIDGIGRKKSKVKNHKKAIKLIIEQLIENKTINNPREIKIVAHRVVHGGHFSKPVIIDKNIFRALKKLNHLAPLHNPHNITGISSALSVLPDALPVAIFDTAFHNTIPEIASSYAIPAQWQSKFGIKRFGFHGNSHKYVSDVAAKSLKNKNAGIISCHLGNGSSITAIKNGKSIDTSMGFTPMEGVMMGTRSGTIDPGIIFYLHEKEKIPLKKIKKELNEESGLKAISGIGSDMRDIFTAYLKSKPTAIKAIDMLAYQVAKYCGAYSAALNGADAIIFTGGIGSNAWYLREKICNYLDFMGVKLDKKKNKASAPEIHHSKSKTKIFVIPTDEEIIMAKEALKLWRKSEKS